MDTHPDLPLQAAIGIDYTHQPDPARQLDVLVPATASQRLMPVAIRFECPAWKAGPRSAAFAGFSNPLLADRGFVTIAASIRPSDDAAWPAQLDDAQQALDWVVANPLGLPVDPQQIVVWGQSAGGHIATMLALTNPKLIRAVAAISTPFDLADSSWTTAQAPDSPVTDLLGGPDLATLERRRSASPIHRLAAVGRP